MDKDEYKTKNINIRIQPDAMDDYKLAAKACGITVSQWIRQTLDLEASILLSHQEPKQN